MTVDAHTHIVLFSCVINLALTIVIPSCRNRGRGWAAPMAPTDQAVRRFSWENQSERLTATHMAVGLAALAIVSEARSRMRLRAPTTRLHFHDPESNIVKNDRAREFALSGIEDQQTQLARQNLAAREMRERIEALSARVTEVDKRYAELQDELDVAREEILLQQNDKYSLQKSIDALVKENAHLVHCLADREAAAKEAHSQIEQTEKALNAGQLARKDLAAALENERQKRRIESDALRAADQERTKLVSVLDRVQQKYRTEVDKLKSVQGKCDKLIAALESAHLNYKTEVNKMNVLETECIKLTEINERHQVEIPRLKSRLYDAAIRADVAESILAKLRQILLEKFKLLQASVGAKDCEIHKLEQSQMKLIDGAKMLMGIFEIRDCAITRADKRIKVLTERIVELEAELHPAQESQMLNEFDRDHSYFGSARRDPGKAMLTATIAF
jgi:chromosome segregation ATPase